MTDTVTKTVFNFSAGPAMLPRPALQKAREEMLSYNDSGMSAMELSHRSDLYMGIIQTAEERLRRLMAIPDNYHVLFLQGGATSQFAAMPLNLMKEGGQADHINTGVWSKKAIAEAKRYGKINVLASSEDQTFNYIPDMKNIAFTPGADYVHITSNNTIYGTTYHEFPDTGDVPLITDMSSHILSQPYDVSKFGLIYAGAQKNIGPAGLTIVIVRDDLIGKHRDFTPTMLQYKVHADAKSMLNTPPTYAIYLAGLVFEWLEEQGGVVAMEKINQEKAALLYNYLDNSKLFDATVKSPHRSLMNIPFVLPSEELNKKFLEQADQEGLKNLKGHRSVGGMRASIYNAMPIEGVQALVQFMENFEKANS